MMGGSQREGSHQPMWARMVTLWEVKRPREIVGAGAKPEARMGLGSLEELFDCTHVGGDLIATWITMAVRATGNLRTGLAGQSLPHCVNPDVFEF